MKYFGFFSLLIGAFLLTTAFSSSETTTAPKEKIAWMSFEEAIEANKKAPKKLFIDVYTDWCGWCKKMDVSTFVDPTVVEYMNENFYAVKLDAEQKEAIVFNDHTFEFVESGRRGIHTLAYSLLEGKASYPSFVFLTENFERIMISPGFKQAEQMLTELEFAGEEAYKTQSLDDYKRLKGR